MYQIKFIFCYLFIFLCYVLELGVCCFKELCFFQLEEEDEGCIFMVIDNSDYVYLSMCSLQWWIFFFMCYFFGFGYYFDLIIELFCEEDDGERKWWDKQCLVSCM